MHYSIFELGVVFECGKINPKSVQIGLLMKVYLSSKFNLDSCENNQGNIKQKERDG